MTPTTPYVLVSRADLVSFTTSLDHASLDHNCGVLAELANRACVWLAAPAAPPVGWRLLEVGETFIATDEVFSGAEPDGRWLPIGSEIAGHRVREWSNPIRRRLPSVPADQTGQQQTVCTGSDPAPAICAPTTAGEVGNGSSGEGEGKA
jgi:hypothetical protein